MTRLDCTYDCNRCGDTFDDYDDGVCCSVCDDWCCVDCQAEHATNHCFTDKDVVMKSCDVKKESKK